MIEIQIFKNEQFGAIRTVVMDNGEPWFVGKDVALALGYALPTKAIQEPVDIWDVKVLKYKAFSKTEKASSFWHGNDYSDKVMRTISSVAKRWGWENPTPSENVPHSALEDCRVQKSN